MNNVQGVHENERGVQMYVRTALIESRQLSQIAGCTVYMKLENTQPCGSFKLRGISNLIHKVSIILSMNVWENLVWTVW